MNTSERIPTNSIGEWTFQALNRLNYKTHYFPTIESTNLVAKESAMTETEPVVFYIADHQTSGRGQGVRTWLNSDPGTNLLMTCSFLTSTPPQPELCLTFGEILHKNCLEFWPNNSWHVKPPNDLLLSDKKVAGILLESVSQGTQHRLLLGLGLNVLDYPKDSSFTATSLQEHSSEPITQNLWEAFMTKLITRLQQDSHLLKAPSDLSD